MKSYNKNTIFFLICLIAIGHQKSVKPVCCKKLGYMNPVDYGTNSSFSGHLLAFVTSET